MICRVSVIESTSLSHQLHQNVRHCYSNQFKNLSWNGDLSSEAVIHMILSDFPRVDDRQSRTFLTRQGACTARFWTKGVNVEVCIAHVVRNGSPISVRYFCDDLIYGEYNGHFFRFFTFAGVVLANISHSSMISNSS